MKKILTFIIILFVSGCTVVRIDTDSIDNIVDVILTNESRLHNRVGQGFKYYIPRGVIHVDTDGLNDRLYSNGNFYFLYVDVVSYYHEIVSSFEENQHAYFSRRISTENGFRHDGFLEITKNDEWYHMVFAYNFAQIEAVVSRRDLNNTVLDAAYILSTIQFNSAVISLRLDEAHFTNREERYDGFSRNETTGNTFLPVEND